MGYQKGQLEYRKFEAGGNLSRKQAMLAMCYACNGMEDSGEDCGGTTCPLYPYHPHNKNRIRGKQNPGLVRKGRQDAGK